MECVASAKTGADHRVVCSVGAQCAFAYVTKALVMRAAPAGSELVDVVFDMMTTPALDQVLAPKEKKEGADSEHAPQTVSESFAAAFARAKRSNGRQRTRPLKISTANQPALYRAQIM